MNPRTARHLLGNMDVQATVWMIGEGSYIFAERGSKLIVTRIETSQKYKRRCCWDRLKHRHCGSLGSSSDVGEILHFGVDSDTTDCYHTTGSRYITIVDTHTCMA